MTNDDKQKAREIALARANEGIAEITRLEKELRTAQKARDVKRQTFYRAAISLARKDLGLDPETWPQA